MHVKEVLSSHGSLLEVGLADPGALLASVPGTLWGTRCERLLVRLAALAARAPLDPSSAQAIATLDVFAQPLAPEQVDEILASWTIAA